MTPERWGRVERLYHAALQRDNGERPAFLDKECAGDAALRREVESLLAQASKAGDFMDAPALMVAARDLTGEPRSSLVGTVCGHYKVLSMLGAGGMGEVYRAHDTKLNRDVALKVLPDQLAHDPDRLARFQREAQVLAALNHPHIAQIYGLVETTATTALAMELVEGEDLSVRIAKGPIPIDEALLIAVQIAEALEAAHEKSIIHRDLKPANIVVSAGGRVKILDFGLATYRGSSEQAHLTHSPTMFGATMAGVLLGTAAYMSPEQARGKAVDRRSDIWAFGCVLFEMLTSKRAFEGDTLTDIVAAVVKNEPAWAALPAKTPSAVAAVLRRCLNKDPARRYHDAADCRIDIEDTRVRTTDTVASPSAGTPPARLVRVAWLAAAGLLGVAALAAINNFPRRVPFSDSPPIRVDVSLPPLTQLYATWHGLSLSQNGETIAFLAADSSTRGLYVRPFGRFEALQIPGTERASAVLGSPRGDAVAFVGSDLALKKVTLADGLVSDVSRDVDYTAGAAWGDDDRITFSRAGSLWQVSAAGGEAARLTTLDPARHELLHAWPTSVDGGRRILFTSITGSNESHIEALTISTRERKTITVGTFPLYTLSGHLVFLRDSALLAIPFDLDRLETRGVAVRVLEDIATDTTGSPLAALSRNGTLLYASRDATSSRIVSVSRDGIPRPLTDAGDLVLHPRVAPDGRHVAFSIGGDLWVYEFARATYTRVTNAPVLGNSYPVWTPDSRQLVFRSRFGLRRIDVDGMGHFEQIQGTTFEDYPTSISPDGSTLLFVRVGGDAAADVYALSLHNDPKIHPIFSTRAYEGGPAFAPNGRWLAYTSDMSGQTQVYLRSFPSLDRNWQVSTHGGTQPLWSVDGTELFYRDRERIMAVAVGVRLDSPSLSEPKVLFEGRYDLGSVSIPNYDVTANGGFVMIRNESAFGRLRAVLNWFTELKRLVPTS